jgi:hypothetical protein
MRHNAESDREPIPRIVGDNHERQLDELALRVGEHPMLTQERRPSDVCDPIFQGCFRHGGAA